jgi:subtilisin family serine protease
MQQAIDDGIIIVGAAGNDSFYIDSPTGQDYNNYFYATYLGTNYIWYCHKGCAPGSASGVITVGAVGSTATEKKASFSNTGPGIDIFAPGQYITSSFNVVDTWTNTTDPRNSSYVRGKISGTSMASPQVAGVIACVLEQYPNMKQNEALLYLISHSKTGQLTSTGGGALDVYDLQLAPNQYLYAYPERPTTNRVFPKINYWIRPASGQVYPRPKRRVYK